MTRELGAYGAGGLAFGTALGFMSGGTVLVFPIFTLIHPR